MIFKLTLTAIFLNLVIFVQTTHANLQGYESLVPQAISAIDMVNLEGQKVSMLNAKGKFIILNFWETYCPHCVQEFKSLNNLAGKFKEKMIVLAVSSDIEAKPQIQRIIKEQNLNNIHFNLIYKNLKQTHSFYKVTSLPTTYIIDPNGYMLGVIHQGLQWDTLGCIEYIQKLIHDWEVSKFPKPLLFANMHLKN